MVNNIIKITGTKKNILSLRQLVEINKLGFEFDAIIKQPKALIDLPDDKEMTLADEINFLCNYGATDILSWRTLYWGTSLPNLKASWFNNTFVKMETSEPPREIYKEISRRFNVKLYIVYTNGIQAGIMKTEKGKITEKTVTGIEAELLTYLCNDENYTFEQWEKDVNNKKAKYEKKIDMKLLFNHETNFIGMAKKILNEKIDEIIF